jgi:hypothetical protein
VYTMCKHNEQPISRVRTVACTSSLERVEDDVAVLLAQKMSEAQSRSVV